MNEKVFAGLIMMVMGVALAVLGDNFTVTSMGCVLFGAGFGLLLNNLGDKG